MANPPKPASKHQRVTEFDQRMEAAPDDLDLVRAFAEFVTSSLVYDRFRDAEEAFRKYYAVRSQERSDRKLFGYALWVNGKTDDAIAQFRLHLESNPKDADVFRFLGFAHFASGNRLDGLLAFSAGLRTAPQDTALRAGALGCEMLLEGKDLVTFDTDGEKIYFHITGRALDPDLSHLLGQFCESDFLELARAHAPRGGGVLDIGSQIGNHAVYFLKFLKPVQLWTFDANPVCCRETLRNLAANQEGSSTEIRVNNIGVGAKPGELYLPDHDELNTGLVETSEGGKVVKIVRLDSLVHMPVDFMKIDIEGMEIDALRGAQGIIDRSKPYLMMEVEDKNLLESDALIADLGYEVAAELSRGDQKHRIYRSKDRAGAPSRNPAWDQLDEAQRAFGRKAFDAAQSGAAALLTDWPLWDQPLLLSAQSLIERFNTNQDQANIDQAIQLLDTLVAYYPEHDEGLRLLARTLAALERTDEAKRRYDALLQLDPDDEEAKAFLERSG